MLPSGYVVFGWGVAECAVSARSGPGCGVRNPGGVETRSARPLRRCAPDWGYRGRGGAVRARSGVAGVLAPTSCALGLWFYKNLPAGRGAVLRSTRGVPEQSLVAGWALALRDAPFGWGRGLHLQELFLHLRGRVLTSTLLRRLAGRVLTSSRRFVFEADLAELR